MNHKAQLKKLWEVHFHIKFHNREREKAINKYRPFKRLYPYSLCILIAQSPKLPIQPVPLKAPGQRDVSSQ